MSYLDYQQGQQFGEVVGAARADAADARAAKKIDDWIAYARKLEAQLAGLQLQAARDSALADATTAVVKELRLHLQELAPKDPLGQRDVVLRKVGDNFRALVERKGYRVTNTATMDISTR